MAIYNRLLSRAQLVSSSMVVLKSYVLLLARIIVLAELNTLPNMIFLTENVVLKAAWIFYSVSSRYEQASELLMEPSRVYTFSHKRQAEEYGPIPAHHRHTSHCLWGTTFISYHGYPPTDLSWRSQSAPRARRRKQGYSVQRLRGAGVCRGSILYSQQYWQRTVRALLQRWLSNPDILQGNLLH